jgi:hypothetical protein
MSMRVPPLPAPIVAVCLLGASLLLCACGSNGGPGGRRMNFAAMQAINPGVEGEWVVAEFPFARNVTRRPDGSLQSLGYLVEDPLGKGRPLMLHFDETGMLTRKQYGGPLVRPPPPDAVGFNISGSSQPGSAGPGGANGAKPSHPQWTPAGYSQSGGR